MQKRDYSLDLFKMDIIRPFYAGLYGCNWQFSITPVLFMLGFTAVCYIFGIIPYFCIEKPIADMISKKREVSYNGIRK